ncbi:MAG TPA: VWA domain-containing protein [Pyrinomonadaceae bacterium]|nr:VWA domain-containing protein [Pyrinomonadaceae bacterium]
MRPRTALLLLVICLGTCVVGFSQTKKDDDEVLKIDTRLVDVPVVITDKTGKPILNLKENNFTVFEDGKQQEVTQFGATSAPFEVALLLDTSGSTRADIELIQRAAQYFIASLRPGDRVAVIAYRTDKTPDRALAVSEVLSSLTEDRAKLKTAVEKAGVSNGTPYYDSLVQVADRVFGDKPKDEFRGRRALVALTDGVDSTSSADFNQAKERLEATGIAAYFVQVDTREFFEENLMGDCDTAIRFSAAQIRRYFAMFKSNDVEKTTDFCKLGEFERLAISKKLYEIADNEMTTLAKESGGKVFPVADLSEARGAFKQVADEIGTKYSLGYYSSNEKHDGTYRKIKVVLKGVPAGTQIRAREGYTAPAN